MPFRRIVRLLCRVLDGVAVFDLSASDNTAKNPFLRHNAIARLVVDLAMCMAFFADL